MQNDGPPLSLGLPSPSGAEGGVPEGRPGPTSLDAASRPHSETTVHRSDRPLWSDTGYQARVHRGHHDQRRRILVAIEAEAIKEAPDEESGGAWAKVGKRLRGCCASPSLWQRAGGRMMLCEARCRSRVCPRCSVMRSKECEARVRELLRWTDDVRLVTLTIRSSSQSLRDQLEHLKASWARLRRAKAWRSATRGGVAVTEITFNSKTGQWHPHLHVIADGSYIRQADLSNAWEAASGSPVCDIRRVPSREALTRYVTKYVSKCQDPSELPESCIAEWAASVHGMRMLQSFGNLHGPALAKRTAAAATAAASATGDDAAAACSPLREPNGRDMGETRHLAPLRAVLEAARRGGLRERRLAAAAMAAVYTWRRRRPSTLNAIGDRLAAWWAEAARRGSIVPPAMPPAPPRPRPRPPASLFDGHIAQPRRLRV